MSMILLIIVLLLLFGGGGYWYGNTRWGPRGGISMLGVVLLIILVLWFLAPGLRGQEPPAEVSTPQPFDLAPAEEPAAPLPSATIGPSVTEFNGAPVAIVPAPPEASTAEVAAVAAQSAENLEAVASGEVSLAAATRDPTSGAPDPGDGGLFWLLSIVFGSVIKPLTDAAVEKLSGVDNRLSGAINTAVVLVTYVGAWALLHDGNPGLPQDVFSWAIAGFAAAGMGAATSSAWRSRPPAKVEP